MLECWYGAYTEHEIIYLRLEIQGIQIILELNKKSDKIQGIPALKYKLVSH
jgi:hypothetical protein